ncbi:hypothetical protein [Rhizobium sp. BR 362]|uniref:hypothetical protein n=1 Tax=Rhizobium sp. BR 362 TaxID=3040670 RepID=UPI002F3E49DE
MSYLTGSEYELLSNLPGRTLQKRRYHLDFGGMTFAVDVFQGELEGLILCEVESASLEELENVTLPDWATVEVTTDPFFKGGHLSEIGAADLALKISSLPFRSSVP